MPSAPTPEPLPPVRELLNLGIILECPFLHQIALPSALQTTVFSSQKPGPSEGVTAYTYLGTRLVQSVFTGGGSEKIIEYHYTPSDPAEKIATQEAELAKSKEELREAKKVKDKDQVAGVKQRLELQKSDLKKLKKQAKDKSFNPMLLQRTTFVENSPGLVGVSGETVFEYDGANIVKATTTSETDEEPPRSAEVAREYRYNDLGQLSEMEMAGCVTEFKYAPTGQLLESGGGFVSPAGDFISEESCVYTYAPPGSNPIPPNAVIASVTLAKSGPAAEFGLPSPVLSEEEKAAGAIPTVDPKEQMAKLAAKKKAETEGAESMASSLAAGAVATAAEAKPAGEPLPAPPSKPAAPEVPAPGEAALSEIPKPEATDTRVAGVYVYA